MSQTWSLLSTAVQYLLQPLSTSVFFCLLSFKMCSKALPAFGAALTITNFTFCLPTSFFFPFFFFFFFQGVSLLFVFLFSKHPHTANALKSAPTCDGGKGFMRWGLAIPSLCWAQAILHIFLTSGKASSLLLFSSYQSHPVFAPMSSTTNSCESPGSGTW